MDEYLRAMDARAALHQKRKAEQAAEAEAAKSQALDEARRYMASMTLADPNDAA